MTTIALRTEHAGSPELHLSFPGWERWMVSRGDYTVACTAITAVRTEGDWSSEILGMRSGLVVSGVLKVARFTHPDGTRRLVSMRRGLPLLRIALRGQEFDELLISTPEATALGAQLRAVVIQDAA